MLNQDIIDLYERVPLGTRVVVLGGPDTMQVIDGVPVAGATPSTEPLPGTTASPYEPPIGPSVTGRAPGEQRPII